MINSASRADALPLLSTSNGSDGFCQLSDGWLNSNSLVTMPPILEPVAVGVSASGRVRFVGVTGSVPVAVFIAADSRDDHIGDGFHRHDDLAGCLRFPCHGKVGCDAIKTGGQRRESVKTLAVALHRAYLTDFPPAFSRTAVSSSGRSPESKIPLPLTS